MADYLWVGAGGAAGSMARYWVWKLVAPTSGGFPWATMAVNVTGSFVLGLLAGILAGRVDPTVRFAVFFGLLGGYTTFSTFTVDTVELFRVGEVFSGVMNVVVAVLAGLAAAWVGILLGEAMNPAI